MGRLNLGEREYLTLLQLLRIAYWDSRFLFGDQTEHSDTCFPIRNVLDVGAGDQFMKAPICSRRVSYTPLDFADCDFEVEPFPVQSSSIDCVLSLAVIEHIRDPSNFMSEAFRSLRPGGLLWLSTPNWWYSSRNFFDDFTHVKPYSPISLVNLVTSFGFDRAISFPNLRCKARWNYVGPFRYARARYCFPFRGDTKLIVPEFLKGKSLGMFVLARKPIAL